MNKKMIVLVSFIGFFIYLIATGDPIWPNESIVTGDPIWPNS